MKDLLNFILIFSILLLITFFYYRNKNINETFITKGSGENPNLNQDWLKQSKRFEIYNQNYDKVWKKPYQSSNYPMVPSYPTSYVDLYKHNQYIFNSYPNNIVEFISKIISQEFDIVKVREDIKKSKEKYSNYELMVFNKKTWINRWREIDPNSTFTLSYIESPIEMVNRTNNNFLKTFNEIFYDFIDDYDKRKVIHYKPYFILKYQLINIYELDGTNICQVTCVVTRDNSDLAFEFLLSAYFDKTNEKDIKKINLEYIGNYSLDNVISTPGLNKFNDHNYNLNKLYENEQAFTRKEIKGLLENIHKKNKENKNILTNTYTCFGYNKNDKNPTQTPIFAVNKNDCENSYDIIGYRKPYGVWDVPCKSDSECIFYKRNENYDNNYGRCVNGTCQLPLNMKNLGYHYYINEKETRPLCYNCNTKKWLPNTKLDFCCEDQREDIRGEHKKYPFLKTPDYAFKNDNQDRYNAYIKKNCKLYKTYDNIFDKTPSQYRVICDSHFDYFLNI